jgi:hypothetical protein
MAYHTLFEQGQRGGPILSLVRMLQAQAKCIRLILVIGEDHPLEAYLFDLVGAQQHVLISDKDESYQDIMLRILTAASTREVTNHQVEGELIPRATWQSLSTPTAMLRAGRELGKRRFFTEMVRVDYLANVPAVPEAVASQYSEGCYATWDPQLEALIATVTGSARPVEKDNLTEDDLAIITGVRPDGLGALVRRVEGKRNDPPSSESVEMMEVDAYLPQIRLGPEWGVPVQVPVVRSKLHGHRGVKAYDPTLVEHVRLDPAYYHYPVSCATDAQARAIRSAFSRSQALNDPWDSRRVVFTVLPGHGAIVEWVPDKLPLVSGRL